MSPKKTVPKPVAIVVIVAVLAVMSFSATRVLDAASKRHGHKPAAAAPATPAD